VHATAQLLQCKTQKELNSNDYPDILCSRTVTYSLQVGNIFKNQAATVLTLQTINTAPKQVQLCFCKVVQRHLLG